MKSRRIKLGPGGPPHIMRFSHLLVLMYDEETNNIDSKFTKTQSNAPHL